MANKKNTNISLSIAASNVSQIVCKGIRLYVIEEAFDVNNYFNEYYSTKRLKQHLLAFRHFNGVLTKPTGKSTSSQLPRAKKSGMSTTFYRGYVSKGIIK